MWLLINAYQPKYFNLANLGVRWKKKNLEPKADFPSTVLCKGRVSPARKEHNLTQRGYLGLNFQ